MYPLPCATDLYQYLACFCTFQFDCPTVHACYYQIEDKLELAPTIMCKYDITYDYV